MILVFQEAVKYKCFTLVLGVFSQRPRPVCTQNVTSNIRIYYMNDYFSYLNTMGVNMYDVSVGVCWQPRRLSTHSG